MWGEGIKYYLSAEATKIFPSESRTRVNLPFILKLTPLSPGTRFYPSLFPSVRVDFREEASFKTNGARKGALSCKSRHLGFSLEAVAICVFANKSFQLSDSEFLHLLKSRCCLGLFLRSTLVLKVCFKVKMNRHFPPQVYKQNLIAVSSVPIC